MKLKFLDSYQWKNEVKKLPKYHQIAFLASICERLLPLYSIFARESKWEDADFSLIRDCLDEVWLYIERKELNTSKVNQLLSNYERIIPDGSSIDYQYVFEAEYAAYGVNHLLQFSLTSDEEFIRYVGTTVHYTIYNYLNWIIDKSSDRRKSAKESDEIVYNHPFTTREMEKENKDLQRLKGMPELTPEFINWFRDLSHEQSECVIDLVPTQDIIDL